MDITTNYSKRAHSNALGATDLVINILQWTYCLVPVIAGADKFTHLLANWDKYLAPPVANFLPIPSHSFMEIVGVIEIIAGVLVFVKPKIGSLIVSIWLVCIAANLIITGQYFDIAVRDCVMAIASFCLYTLLNGSKSHEN